MSECVCVCEAERETTSSYSFYVTALSAVSRNDFLYRFQEATIKTQTSFWFDVLWILLATWNLIKKYVKCIMVILLLSYSTSMVQLFFKIKLFF